MTNEEENCFRILKELPPIVSSRWCFFGIHTWTKWTKPIKSTEYHKAQQTRYCVHCHKVALKKFSMSGYNWEAFDG